MADKIFPVTGRPSETPGRPTRTAPDSQTDRQTDRPETGTTHASHAFTHVMHARHA